MSGSVIGALRVNLGLDSAQFETGAKRVKTPLEAMRKQFLAVSAVAVGLGVALTAMAMKGAAGIDEVAKSARRVESSIGGFRALQLAAGEAGVSVDTLVDSVQTMDRELAKGSKAAAESLKTLRLNASDIEGLEADQKIALIADRVEALGLSAGQTSAVLQGFGIRNREMILAVQGGGGALRKAREDVQSYGLAISEVDATRIEVANDAIGRLSIVGQYLAEQLALKIVPALGMLAQAITDSMRDGGLLRAAIDGIATAAGAAVSVITAFAQNMETVGVVIAGLAATQVPALIGALAAKALALGAAGVAAGIAAGAMTALNAAVMVLGGPIGLLAGALGAAAAAFVIFGRDSGVAEQGAYNVAAAEAALSGELDVFSQSASPAAREESRKRVISLQEQAKAALAAAQAELALASAMAQENVAMMDSAIAFSSVDTPVERTDKGWMSSDYIQGKIKNINDLKAQVDNLNESIASMDATGGGGGTDLPGVPFRDSPDSEGGKGKGGGGGGGGKGDGFDQRLEKLKTSLQTERETLDAWYAEQMEILADRRSMEILGEEGHKAAMIAVEQEYQDKLKAIQQAATAQRLGATASLFGSLAQIASAGGKRMAKIAATAGAIEGTINAYVAATDALRKAPTIAGKFAAYASVLAAGLKGVAAIRAAGGVGGGGGGGGSGGMASAAAVEPQKPVQTMNFTIQNDPFGYGERFVRQFVTQLNEASQNGAQVRGAILT